jgi:hypothetical protein
MKKRAVYRRAGTILALLLVTCRAAAQAISETLSGINDLIYGIIAGIATLMLIFHALKWKTAESPQDIQKAKKGMITVILGLILVMIAGTAVNVLYGEKTGGNAANGDYVGNNGDYIERVSTSTRLTTTRKPTTTTVATTSSTTTSTSSTIPYLTAANLVDRINSAGGFLVSRTESCPNCVMERDNVFGMEPDGAAAYANLRKWDPPTGYPTCKNIVGVPTWCSGAGMKVTDGCKTLSQLNAAYSLGLICKPGYTYYNCNGNVIGCP